jgi:hypothetical protein
MRHVKSLKGYAGRQSSESGGCTLMVLPQHHIELSRFQSHNTLESVIDICSIRSEGVPSTEVVDRLIAVYRDFARPCGEETALIAANDPFGLFIRGELSAFQYTHHLLTTIIHEIILTIKRNISSPPCIEDTIPYPSQLRIALQCFGSGSKTCTRIC